MAFCVESQALLCEVDATMALFAIVLEEIAELDEELSMPLADTRRQLCVKYEPRRCSNGLCP